MTARRAAQSGFTLIELLVSLTLLGLMMALIGMALPLAMSAAARTSALSDEFSAIQTTHQLLRRQIGEMPFIAREEGHMAHLIFSGKADAMRFAANRVAAQGGGGPRMIELSVERTGSGQGLAYADGGEKRMLVSGADGVSFSYFGPHQQGREPVWRDDWKDTQHLPVLVRIQVQPKPGALPWPDLVIAVQPGPPPP